jgi:DNA-binding MarR family transcriptional regulator
VSRTKNSRRLARGTGDHIQRDFLPLNDLFHRRVFAGLARRGYGDLRDGHQAVFINIEDEGTTLTELAARANISKQAMHELVNDLEARGYVERVPSATDGRSKLIRTTDKGERTMEAAWDAIAEIEREWTTILGTEAMQSLRASLRTLHAYYKEREPIVNGSAIVPEGGGARPLQAGSAIQPSRSGARGARLS